MIDVHAHLFFEELLGAAGEFGPRIEPGPEGHQLVTGTMCWPVSGPRALAEDPQDRIAALDRAGVDLQIASLSPLWLFHHAAATLAVPFARRANDLLAAWCVRTGGRVRPLAQLPAQDATAAAAELTRCVAEHGALGGFIGSDARPHLDSTDLDPVYEACVRLDVPLFVHAAMPGIDGPPGDPRLDRWTGHAVLGYPLEDTVAVTAFLLGDVLDRHPGLDVCFSHGGGAVPFLWGRLQAFAGTTRSPVDRDTLTRRMHRLWFDQHVHHAGAVRLLHEVAHPDHLVFGSNFGGWDAEHTGPLRDDALAANGRALLRL
jgi:aminocarboxymuconate-semialdehyde decarboxylase